MQVFLLAIFSPWLITVSLVVIILFFLYKLPSLLIAFFHLPHGVKGILLVSLILGFYVRLVMVPQYHRIYYDEDRYLAYAVTFAKFGKATNINYATPTNLIKGTPDLVARLTVPTINAWVFKFVGFSEDYLYVTAKLFSGVQILLVFILTALFIQNMWVAALSSLLMALLPTNVYWSTSTNIDAYFVFFALLSFIAALIYSKKPNSIHMIFFVSSILLLQYVRFEALLFFMVLAYIIVLDRIQSGKALIQKIDYLTAFLLFFVVGLRIFISYSVLSKTWCCGESTPLEVFGLSYFFRNVLSNVLSFVNRPEFPFIISICAFIALFRKIDGKLFALALWMLFYFVLYSFYYAGLFFSYQFSGSYGRYFLMLIPPLCILASVTIVDFFQKTQISRKKAVIYIVLTIILLYPTITNYKRYISTSPWYNLIEREPREKHVLLESDIIPALKKDSILIHPLTALILMHGQGAIYYPSFQIDDSIIRSVLGLLKQGKPVYLYSPATCYVYPEQCKKFEPYIDVVQVMNPKTKEFFREFAELKLINKSVKPQK